MSISDLKDELKAREQTTTGARADLEARLCAVLAQEPQWAAPAPAAAAAAAPERAAALKERAPVQRHSIASWRHALLREALPSVRVAVITGGPSEEAAVSLASARTLLDLLQTVPYPEQAEQLRHHMVAVRARGLGGECWEARAGGLPV